jgi:hypothetical protein
MPTPKNHFYLLLSLTAILFSCAKEESKQDNTVVPFPACKPAPQLTGVYWKADTIIINAPVTYNQLSSENQTLYKGSLAWFKGANMLFNTDCKILQTMSDWDNGFDKWSLSDDNKDIRILLTNGNIDTLYNYSINNSKFTYERKFAAYTLTYIMK